MNKCLSNINSFLFIYPSQIHIYIFILILFLYRKLCSTDDDCPAFSHCEIGMNNNYCSYQYFICPEDINANCHFLNKTIWNDVQSRIKLTGIGEYEFLGCKEITLNEDFSMYSLAYQGTHFSEVKM